MRTRALVAILSAGLLLAAPCVAPPPPEWPISAPAGRDAGLWSLLDDYVTWQMQESPVWASQQGDERWNDRLADNSPEAEARRARAVDEFFSRLNNLDGAQFGEADIVDASLLRRELELSITGRRFHPEQFVLDARWGPQIDLPSMHRQLPFLKPKHYADFAARLEAVPASIDQSIAQMRRGLEAGRVPPRAAVAGAADQCDALADERFTREPQASAFYEPFLALPENDPAAVRARAAIAEGITPAFARLARFVREEYEPKCRDSYGASEGVDGLPAYEHALRQHTTLELTAEEIHQTGLVEVARIRAEMMDVIRRSDFTPPSGADDEATFKAFIESIRVDPRFHAKSPEELVERYQALCKRIDAELPRLFRVLPRLPYGVREMPRMMAPASPNAYYLNGSLESGVAGTFIVNTYRLDQRPTYEMIALALHEAVPGHHFQIALAQEAAGVHRFRTLLGYTAFVEGWALYAESLGLEMGESPRSAGGRGFFEDPYDDFGRLTYEMWRACRLVVDTGIHAKGWSRQQAIDFMLANSALSPHNIEREVDRYIGWPGQACGYKIGEIAIQRLRRECEAALGKAFDLRAFHDVVLSEGALPLNVLEQRVSRWVAGQRRSG